MIQRIQSLFLLMAILFLVLFLVLPLAGDGSIAGIPGTRGQTAEAGGSEMSLRAVSSLPQFLLSVILVILLVITLLRFRKRNLQMSYSLVCVALLAGLQFLAFLRLWQGNGGSLEGIRLHLPVVFPLVSVLWVVLAYVYIRKDEKRVRSADRIR